MMEDYAVADKIVDPPRTFAYSMAVSQLASLASIEDVLTTTGGPTTGEEETGGSSAAPHRPVTLIDLGTCDARTAVPFFRACANRLRGRPGWRPDQPIQVVFEDHRHNDWAPVTSRNLRDELNTTDVPPRRGSPSAGPHRSVSSSSSSPTIFPLLSTTSFFEATVPPNTVDLAFTNCAFHYLSRAPPKARFHKAIRHVTADARRDQKAIAAFRAAARQDWETLLLRRADELRDRGVLVVSNFAWDEDRDFHWGKTDTGASLYEELAACVQDLVDRGRLTVREQRRMTTPAYYRTLREHRAPFDDPDSAVSRAGLRLRTAAINITRCPFRRDLLDRCTGPFTDVDMEEYATRFTRCFRSVTAWEVQRAFDDSNDPDDDAVAHTTPHPSRSADERAAILDEVYRLFADRVKQRPLDFCFDSVMAILVIDKVPKAAAK